MAELGPGFDKITSLLFVSCKGLTLFGLKLDRSNENLAGTLPSLYLIEDLLSNILSENFVIDYEI